MINRWDETWHRLREWTNGQAPSERLAAQILLEAGYSNLDPSHPLGGPDGKKDAICEKDGKKWLMAVYFPRGQKRFTEIKKKFLDDLKGVESNKVEGIAFVTNQEISVIERSDLEKTSKKISLDLFHLEKIVTVLDKPDMCSIRQQFLQISSINSSSQGSNRILSRYVDTAWYLYSKFDRLQYKMANRTQSDSLGLQIQYEINERGWELKRDVDIINSTESNVDQSLREKSTKVYNFFIQIMNTREGSLDTFRSLISQLSNQIENDA